jgi:hypothetical protein
VLVAHHLPKLGAHLVIALARLSERNIARRSSLKTGTTRAQKGGRGVETKLWFAMRCYLGRCWAFKLWPFGLALTS